MSTVFTKIIEGEIPSYKIYEDEKTLAFLDIEPETAGHTLVIPKIEVDKIYELPEEYYVAVWDTAKKVAAKMEEVLGSRTLFKVIGTDVPHAHIHLTQHDPNYQPGQKIETSPEYFAKMQEKLRF